MGPILYFGALHGRLRGIIDAAGMTKATAAVLLDAVARCTDCRRHLRPALNV